MIPNAKIEALENAPPENICNKAKRLSLIHIYYCFEADITNNELTFSYQMRNGVAQNMNACFLMKKMGIAVTVSYTHLDVYKRQIIGFTYLIHQIQF